MRNSFPEVLHTIIGLGRRVEGNPDIKEIIMKIEEEFRKFGEESRFLIFVKTRSTAEALSERLPPYLRSTYLTGSHISKDKGGKAVKDKSILLNVLLMHTF
jgi:ERCC4-related helicase